MSGLLMPIFQRVAVVFLLLVLVNPVAALGREATSHATDDADFCAPQNLQVEYQSNPLGVEPATSPRFSFQLCSGKRAVSQTAYRITVQQVHPAGEVSTVWDSGQVSSNTSTNIAYPTTGATPLEPDADYTWNVTVWSASSGASPSSLPATFSTGVTYPVDWHNATWIGHPNNTNTTHVYLRNTFSVPAGRQVVRAMAHVVGLGYYKLHIDGTQVSTHELGAFTTYEKRVLYDTYDCLQALRVGANPAHTVAIELGPGWYSEKSVAVGTPTLLLHLSVTFDDGTTDHVVSSPGNGWEAAAGPVVAAEMYAGETYDARLEIAGWSSGAGAGQAPWVHAAAAAAPSDSVLVSSHTIMPAIGVRQTFSPCDMWQSSPGVYVFDFCQNMAGYTILNIPQGAITEEYAGLNVSVLHAEAIHGPPPSKIFHHYGNTAEVNSYIMNGNGEAVAYKPLFVYMGFRYAQVTGYPGEPDFESLSAVFLNTMYDEAGSVRFSDPNLDGVQHITRTAAMSNFQSIPTDCPQRERRGWLGDAQLSSETNVYNFNMAGAYSNFVALINDAQNNESNATQDCVPWYGHGHEPADPAWGSAYTFLANIVAEHYKDDRIFAEHYDGIKGHLDSLRAEAAIDGMDGLLTFSWWGDWCPPSGCKPDGQHHQNSALVSSFEYILQLRMVARYAGILGHSDDANLYSSIAANVSNAFVAHFFDPKTNTFVEPNRPPDAEELSVQTCIALASTLGLIPENAAAAVFENLVEDVMEVHGGHLNVGIVGVKELLPALSDGGRVDVALTVAQTETQPGWVYMVLQGATTLWETWTGSRYQPVASWNHIMFGSQSAWYFKYLAGLRLSEGSRGWENVEFRPYVWAGAASPPRSICGNLSSVEASVVTIRGPAAAAWQCPMYTVCQDAVPEHSTAQFNCPVGSTVTSVGFASFGTPLGSCADNSLAINASCHANTSKSIVEAACLGKNNCTVDVDDTVFGDPCLDVQKVLSAQLTCSPAKGEGALAFTYRVTVPVGSTGSVILPTMGVDPTKGVTVTEGGSAVWQDGSFVAGGAVGVGAAEILTDATGQNIKFAVGSGDYDFAVATIAL